MKHRAFTVGSLIPGSVLVDVASIPLPVEKVNPNPKPIPKPNLIIVEQHGSQFKIHPVKGKLLDVALSQNQPIQYKCRKGTCGQCTVKIVQAEGLSAPNEQEHKKLENQLNIGYRLACQVEIQ